VTAHPTTSAVAAEAVVNLDGTATWSIGGGTAEPITATTAAALPYAVLYRTVVAAADRGTAIELTATLAGIPILLGVSPTGEITRFEMAPAHGVPPVADLSSEPLTNRHVPLRGAEQRRSIPRPRRAIAAAAGALAAAAVAGLVVMRGAGGGSPSPSMVPTTSTAASTPAVSPFTSEVVPAAAERKLDVTVRARKGGPLTAQVSATAAPTVATLTIWRGGRRIAKRQLHLTAARATWSSGTVTLKHTRPGSYRWAATAPGAARVTGTYTVKPAPPERRARRSTRQGALAVTPPPTQVPATSAPVTHPQATVQPSTPPPPADTRRPEPHNGPVPGGSTSPPYPGPRP
jgi:hypothetical protein